MTVTTDTDLHASTHAHARKINSLNLAAINFTRL